MTVTCNHLKQGMQLMCQAMPIGALAIKRFSPWSICCSLTIDTINWFWIILCSNMVLWCFGAPYVIALAVYQIFLRAGRLQHGMVASAFCAWVEFAQQQQIKAARLHAAVQHWSQAAAVAALHQWRAAAMQQAIKRQKMTWFLQVMCCSLGAPKKTVLACLHPA